MGNSILSGSLYAKDYFSSTGIQSQVTPQAKDNPATPSVGAIGITTHAVEGNIDVFVGPFEDGSIRRKWWAGVVD